MKKRITMILLTATLAITLSACGEAGKVTKSIESIGEITLESGNTIETAEAAYAELSDKDKEKVENYDTLVAAREEYDALVIEDAYAKAMDLYDQKKYEDAKEAFQAISGYKDAGEKIKSCDVEMMYLTYADVYEALEGNFWYFNGGSDVILKRITFAKADAEIAQVSYDGNGRWEDAPVTCAYVVEDSNISLSLEDGSTMQIAYKMKDGKIKLGDKEYFTEKQVNQGLQGYWKYRDLTGKHEYTIYFNDGKVISESASASAYGSGYFYYGPYEGTYTLGFGEFETEMRHAYEWGFNILNGEVAPLRFGHVCIRTDSLPGENGYNIM